MADIYNKEISITLTGAEWFALLVVLNYHTLPKGKLSKEGETKLKNASRTIAGQMLAYEEVAQ